MNRTKHVVLAAAGLVLPLGVASQADASTTAHGCTVTPAAPTSNAPANPFTGPRTVKYTVTVHCDSPRTVLLEARAYEADPGADTLLGSGDAAVTLPSGGSKTFTSTLPAPDTEPGDDEVYQRVRFKVLYANGSVSDWTAWESSPVTVVPSIINGWFQANT
jgi:hypothetical protein